MINALVEIVFVAFPVTFIATVLGLAAGGFFLWPYGPILGGLIGLICGGLLEQRLQTAVGGFARRKWMGALFVVGLILIIGTVAILTR